MMCQNIGWTTVVERGNTFATPSPKIEEAPEHTSSSDKEVSKSQG